MTAQFARIEELFHAALDRPTDEREPYLLKNEPDAELRAAVLRLLARHFAGDETLRHAVATAAAAQPTFDQIGPYRVLRELGAGGMGTVVLAERTFGETRQKVALKLIRGLPTAKAREALMRERNLLAELNHPNIAGLLDAGETDDHVPYLAMEYVDGAPLHQYCAKHDLDLRARLALFAQLCRAVQHAHQRLIVHRDIKPGNVLVREDGTPVLLDFGIGKLIDVTDRDATATHVFTPAYASPEQLAGRGVTTATDIWGLGCVLHELVSDRRLSEINQDGTVPPPSAAALDTGRARQLRGDLDTLVGKAMHREPERRYASAQALADDVDNYLCGKPLHAAPDSFVYRAHKFVARNRIAAVATATVVVLAGVFVWRLDAERQRARSAESRAEREAQSTRRSRDFLVSLFEAAAPDNALGHPLSARELIDKGSTQVEQELKDEPQSAARLDLTIAQVYARLGDPKAAVTAGERALALAAGAEPEQALLRADILLTLASEYDNTERFEDARKASEEALTLRQKHAADDHAGIALALTMSADAATRRSEKPLARALLDRAMAEYALLPKVDSADQADVLRSLSDLDAAEGKLAESLRHAEQAVQALADLPPMSPARIESLRTLATAQEANGNGTGAATTLTQALDIAHAALGETSYKVADIENDLAVALNQVGRYRDAIAHLEKSIAATQALRPDARVATAFSTLNLGSIYEALGDYAKAEELMRGAIAVIEAESPDESHLDGFRGNLARTLARRGAHAQAHTLFEQVLRNIAAREGESSFAYAFQLYRFARVELLAGNLDAADGDLRDALKTLDPLLPRPHALRVQADIVRGLIEAGRGEMARAQVLLAGAEREFIGLHDEDPVNLASVRMRLAGVLLAQGDLPAARQKLDAALPVLTAALLPQAVEVVEARSILADLSRREAAAR